jgi:hypothetical protein
VICPSPCTGISSFVGKLAIFGKNAPKKRGNKRKKSKCVPLVTEISPLHIKFVLPYSAICPSPCTQVFDPPLCGSIMTLPPKTCKFPVGPKITGEKFYVKNGLELVRPKFCKTQILQPKTGNV